MAIFNTIKDIAALLAGEIFGRILLGAGIFGIVLGGILVYIITDFILRWLGFEAQTVKIITALSSVLTFFLSVISVVLGILLLVWAKKKKL